MKTAVIIRGGPMEHRFHEMLTRSLLQRFEDVPSIANQDTGPVSLVIDHWHRARASIGD